MGLGAVNFKKKTAPQYLVAQVAAKSKGVASASVAASAGVHLADVHLDGSMVLGGDEAVGPSAVISVVQSNSSNRTISNNDNQKARCQRSQ